MKASEIVSVSLNGIFVLIIAGLLVQDPNEKTADQIRAEYEKQHQERLLGDRNMINLAKSRYSAELGQRLNRIEEELKLEPIEYHNNRSPLQYDGKQTD